ncbi:hypothetical protein J6590_058033 [Homalodisca vitripennis]|nr:hypothetical protein J6590_058033 [Homalodisca vitripennis]
MGKVGNRNCFFRDLILHPPYERWRELNLGHVTMEEASFALLSIHAPCKNAWHSSDDCLGPVLYTLYTLYVTKLILGVMTDRGPTITEHFTRVSQRILGRLRDAVCRILTCCMTHSVLTIREPDYLYERLTSRNDVSQRRSRHGGKFHFLKVSRVPFLHVYPPKLNRVSILLTHTSCIISINIEYLLRDSHTELSIAG